ncbi:MAG TPA: cobyrinate a,c-diamide synthase [Pseudonocardia sp.]|jgi:cobyrinic acid a,c-diamide synthase
MTSAIVIAAAASGTGKTTVATGLMGALRRAGHVVAPFKVGPDYIDPGYHALATGRAGRNLDPVLVGEHRIGPLFAHGSAGADIAVVEGVMGLFDGRIGPAGAAGEADGSTAHVARLLGAPVLLVMDCRGQGHSLAAVLHGLATFQPGTRVSGVLLNHVGSPRHEEVLRQACEQVGLPVLGALPRASALAVPSRHLGLVTAAERGVAATEAVAAMAELVIRHVDLAAVRAVAGPVRTGVRPWNASEEVGEPSGSRPVVAVAGGRAFSFGYAEHTELLSAAGAEVALLDPLRDERLPAGTAGLVLPGGFPEEHGTALAGNAALRAEVAALVRAGAPVRAECGGLLYLTEELDGRPMCGVLTATSAMTGRLRLGYRDAVALADSAVYRAGERVTGHEFHRTEVRPAAGAPAAWRWTDRTGPADPEGFAHGSLHASYLHVHPAGYPGSVARFVAACAGPTPARAPGPEAAVGSPDAR